MIAQHLLAGGAEECSPAYTADVGMGLCILLQLTGTCEKGMPQVLLCLPLSLLHSHVQHEFQDTVVNSHASWSLTAFLGLSKLFLQSRVDPLSALL